MFTYAKQVFHTRYINMKYIHTCDVYKKCNSAIGHFMDVLVTSFVCILGKNNSYAHVFACMHVCTFVFYIVF